MKKILSILVALIISMVYLVGCDSNIPITDDGVTMPDTGLMEESGKYFTITNQTTSSVDIELSAEDFGYKPTGLESLSDAEINELIDFWYNKMASETHLAHMTNEAVVIQVYQNELILRELRKLNGNRQ